MSAQAGAQVKSKTYNFVLRTLLSHDVPEIMVDDAVKFAESAIALDAREKEEYDVSHLLNARFVGYKNFDLWLVKDLPKDKPILVYCSVGKRSEDISEKLMKQGFTNVYNLYGGIFEWVNDGHPVYDLKGRQTNKVHGYSKLWGRFLDKGEKVY